MKSIKILMVLALMVVLIGNASAFLDVKDFDPTAQNYGEIQVSDWLFFQKADYRLMDYGCSVIDCYAEGEYNLHKKTHLFTGVFYKDILGSKGELRDANFFIWKNKTKTEYKPTYESSCYLDYSNSTEGKQVCENTLVSNDSIQVDDSGWVPYEKGMELEESSGKWRLEAKRMINKPVDFILTAHGKEFVEWAWWDASWSKKKAINVSVPSGSYTNNYQVEVNVTFDSDMNSDFSDLRFINLAEDEELDYWIEWKVDGEWAWVWFNTTEDITTTNTTIAYMYYGNSGASSNENPEDMFLFFDDFNRADSGTIGNGWTEVETGGPASIENNTLKVVLSSANAGIYQDWGTPTSDDEWRAGYSFSSTTGAVSGHALLMMDSGCSSYGVNVQGGRDGNKIGAYTGTHEEIYSTSDWGDYRFYHIQVYNTSTDDEYNVRVDGWKSTDRFGYVTDSVNRPQCVNMGQDTNAKTTRVDYVYVADSYIQSVSFSFGEEENSNAIEVNLVSPENYYNSSSQSINFECNATDETGVYSLNLTINGSVYATETGAGNTNLTLTSTEVLADGSWEWVCTANDDTQTLNSSTRYLTIDSSQPIFTLNEPTTNETTSTLPINVTLNITTTDPHLDSCWYSTNENSTNVTYTCNTAQNISFANEGEYTITYCANDTFNWENCESVSNTIFYYTYSQSQSQDSVGEGDSVTFNLYVNMTNTPDTNAVFTINNTEDSSVAKYEFTNYTRFVKTIVVPDGWGNSTGNLIDWYWTFNITGVTYENTTTQQLNVYEVAIDDCGSYGTKILNYTLYDEETKSNSLPTPLANQSIEIDVLIESYDNSSLSWNYSKKETGTNTMDICVPSGLLNYSNYILGVVTRYKADDHVVEFHYYDNFNLSIDNIPQDVSLYDLYTGTERSEYSTSFLVNYQDEYYLPVESAIIDLLRYYVDEGDYISVENAQTDVDGNTRLHLVTEDVRYYAVVRVDGEVVYTSPTFLALCQATPCQINFQKQNDVTPTNLTTIDNLNYYVTLDEDAREVEMTYSTSDGSSVNVQLNVTKWNAYENETICTDSATSSGGTLTCSVPLSATNSTYLVQIARNGESLPQYTFDLNPSPYDTFGYTGVFLTGLLFLTLVLMAISSGPIAVVVFGLLGIIFAGMLNLFSGGSIIGVGASLMWLIIAGIIIIIKASSRRSGG